MVDTWTDHPGGTDEPDPVDEAVDAALRTLRADVAPMTPHAFVAGRARLTAAIGTAIPAEPVTAPAEPVVLALPAAARRSPPPRRAAPWLTAAAAVTAVAATTVALLPGSSSPVPGAANPIQAAGSGAPRQTQPKTPPSPTADPLPNGPLPAMPAQPLNPAGDLAAVSSDLTLKPGEVLYLASTRTDAPVAGSPGGSLTIQLWVPADRTHSYWLVKRSSTGEIKGAPAGGSAEEKAPGGKFHGNTYTGPDESPWAPTPDNVAALSQDPAALYAKLRADVNGPQAKPGGDPTELAVSTLFTLIGDQYATVPADLRAALLRTLGYLPGVTVTPNTHATDGRPAVTLSWHFGTQLMRTELLLDPATARPLELRTVATMTAKGFQAGQTSNSQVRTEAIVHALGQLP